jgi:Tol biopolymer transport system component
LVAPRLSKEYVMTHHPRPSTRLRTPVVTAGLALAVTATSLLGTAPAYAAGSHNEQVVLVNGTNAQADAKSAINGTAQVSSADGRYVVFSTAAALVPRDTNGLDDVYLRDTVDDITILVSNKGKTIGNDYSTEPTISGDGRYVAFTTWATNLFRDRNGSTLDVVVKDMQTGKLRLLSVGNDGKQYQKNSFFPVLSGNGKRVAFQTFAPFGKKDHDKKEDVYVAGVKTGVVRQVSLNRRGHDIAGPLAVGDISDNGKRVTFGNDNDLWVRKLAVGKTTRFWHEPDTGPCTGFPAGTAGRPVISGNGKFVAFSTCSPKIPGADGEFSQVYRMRLSDRSIRMVSATGHGAADNHSYLPSLSTSGRYVGFGSDATDLAPDTGVDPDAFVADLKTGTITRASQSPGGDESNNWSASTAAAISGDGRSLVYESYATNLVDADAYDWEEVFVWRR